MIMTNMDQDKAKVLFREGAILLFLGVPEGTEFGIDYNSWKVGAQFRGVKMIPPGVHFVYYSACTKEGETGPRTGFFYNFKQREIVVRKWDNQLEDIGESDVSPEDMQRYHDNTQEMDKFLGPYPYNNYKTWVSLSSYITGDLACRLSPEKGKIASVSEFVSDKSTSQSRKENNENNGSFNKSGTFTSEGPVSFQEAEDRLPDMKTTPGTSLRFSAIPKNKCPPGSSPAEITKHNIDSSYTLEYVLLTYCTDNSNDILGEIQFSFICFLIGQVYDAFDQWKKLVHLLCSSEDALAKHTDLYLNFITILHFQVKEIPEDFFVDIVSQDNFLTSTLRVFFANIESCQANEVLRKKGLKFRDHLTLKFKWDFVSVPDDDEPVVVSLVV
ncbi:protein AAR2 homolog [Pecten maximus]|uniref:protein AAR2 homolog n=1 Tax=Pecten maximus TaxID=6579 RepID=UPI001458FB12|nr:protein AAR2 homolog [Pecten maximus]XP_033757863.1 protein AAR2 homolog [Pecten maximus]XP_033757864.1 protein AAR2 homolog [Pecten maximus]